VQALKPDVLVLDIEMPDMNGISVARELRTKNVPVSIVILSACDVDHFIEEVLQVGVDSCLNKSESPAKIHDVISKVSEKHGLPLHHY
jgi:DNA-binding NarL/FixJ family response regulator